jgi:hypothetical protein
LWIGASEAPTGFKIYVPDPSIGQVGYFGVLKEFDRPVLLALRLKVQNRQITEAEHIIARTLNEPGLKNLAKPRPALLADVPLPSARRVRRCCASPTLLRFHPPEQRKVTPTQTIARHENGMVTSGNRAPSLTAPRQRRLARTVR